MTFIFNSSMPRAGSELMQVILHQNPQIYGSATSPLMEYQYGMRANTGLSEVKSQPKDLMDKAFISSCRGVAEGYYSALTDRPVVCDKNRGWATNYHWLSRWSPAPKIIVMVRDLRGILASLERIYRKNAHTSECAQLPTQLDRRLAHWLDMNMQTVPNNPSIGSTPLGLALNRIHGYSMDGTSDHLLFVKYEDLCQDPAATMSRVYAYLGMEEFQHDFDHIQKEVVEDCSFFGVFGDHNVSPKIKPAQKWHDVLPESLSDLVRKEYDWYFSALRY